MPSPFPGLDPYLEAHWRDVHTCLMVYAADAIQEQLPEEKICSPDAAQWADGLLKGAGRRK